MLSSLFFIMSSFFYFQSSSILHIQFINGQIVSLESLYLFQYIGLILIESISR